MIPILSEDFQHVAGSPCAGKAAPYQESFVAA